MNFADVRHMLDIAARSDRTRLAVRPHILRQIIHKAHRRDGGRAASFFQQYGIQAVTGATGTVDQAVQAFLLGQITGSAPCGDHGHEHGHDCDDQHGPGHHDAQRENWNLTLRRDELSARLKLKLSADPEEIVPGVWTTGEIDVRTEFEGRSKELLMAVGDELVADAQRDDMALVLQSDERLGLLCGCCHAGLLSTLAHVARLFPERVGRIIGGLRLAGVADGDLRRACAKLAAMPALQHVFLGHCSGAAAFLALAPSLGPVVVRTSPVGTTIEIQGG